ncbi:MAG: hypothetical protein K5885_08955 [Bacteroidales bacterium]|nr:hypothetical protein [Bacteroidales bacterium]
MGTLFEQPKRLRCDIDENSLLSTIDMLKSVSKESKLDFKTVVDIYHADVLNRFNACYLNNGEAFDEQMSGIGRILADISESIKNIKR